MLDDGSHGMLEAISASIARYFPRQFAEFVTGYLAGFGVGAIGIQARNLLLAATLRAFLPFTEAKNHALARLATTLLAASNCVNSQLFAALLQAGLDGRWRRQPRSADDGPAAPGSPDLAAAAGLRRSRRPRARPRDRARVAPLPTVAGAAVPTLFRLASATAAPPKTSSISSFDAVPPGFAAQTSVESVPVAPGETAQVGVCLLPSGALGAPGSNAAFTVRVTPQSNPGGAVPGDRAVPPARHSRSRARGFAEGALHHAWHAGRHHDHPDVRRQRGRVDRPRARAATRPRCERRSGERPAGAGLPRP